MDGRKSDTNTGFTTGRVTCKLETLCFYSSPVQVDSSVLRNPHKRTTTCIRNSGISSNPKVSDFNLSQCKTESEVLISPLLLIHTKRYTQSKLNFS